MPDYLAISATVLLRDATPADADARVRWLVSGEWRQYDAPWEDAGVVYTPELLERHRQKFIAECAQALPTPRTRALIATRDDIPIGRVTRYAHARSTQTWCIGIDICEDAYLNRGLGATALRLWIEYLFTHSTIHRLGLDTWSLNPRMKRVAEKVGLVYEGAQRQVLEWQGRWLDLLHFGILQSEWEKR